MSLLMRPCIAIPRWRAPAGERTRDYCDSLRACGAGHVLVDGDRLPLDIQGLLLTGGIDVDPRLYGERPGPETDRPHRRRDAQELALLRQALEQDLPVLAVCRGHQLLNVALGGRLLQHIGDDSHRAAPDGSSRWHEVRLEGKGRLARIYGAGAILRVNSRHHQGVSPDGLIEAVESLRHRWVVGVQWHPERPEMHPASDALFAAFVDACRR